jgi:hypothetical protein
MNTPAEIATALDVLAFATAEDFDRVIDLTHETTTVDKMLDVRASLNQFFLDRNIA